jgi:hypothetical protein
VKLGILSFECTTIPACIEAAFSTFPIVSQKPITPIPRTPLNELALVRLNINPGVCNIVDCSVNLTHLTLQALLLLLQLDDSLLIFATLQFLIHVRLCLNEHGSLTIQQHIFSMAFPLRLHKTCTKQLCHRIMIERAMTIHTRWIFIQ